MKQVWVAAILAAVLAAALLGGAASRKSGPSRTKPTPRVAAEVPVPGSEVMSERRPASSIEPTRTAQPVEPQQGDQVSRAELRRRALENPDPRVWRPALMALSRQGTPEAYAILAEAIQDVRDHEKASDAVGALARYPTCGAVETLQALLGGSSTQLARLRALQGLVLLCRWTPVETAGPEGQAALGQAKAILLSEGVVAASAIERDSRLAAFRYEAKQIRHQIETSIR
ncbi:MAG: HEAT repeat domain-containing protein [Planctomycetes bacterium]|nr:HEAT repeat domain-containing protein [Planctomycetota bacterium]